MVTAQAQLIIRKSKMINKQNLHLKKIASVQSHEVRGHVATILGLSELFDNENPSNEINKNILTGMKQSAINLDKVIREINSLTNCEK